MERSQELGVVGVIDPWVRIQQDTRACFSAIVLSLIGPDKVSEFGIQESQITNDLISADLATENGLGLHSAEALNTVLNKYGLHLDSVFPAWGCDDLNITRIQARLKAVEVALESGKQVIVAYPKQREGLPTVFHYVLVSGYQNEKEGRIVSVMDPSDVDGGLYKVKWQDFVRYVSPADGEGVKAWGVREFSGHSKNSVMETNVSPRDLSDEKLDTPGLELLEDPLWMESQTGMAIPPGTNDPISTAMTTREIMDQWSQLGESILEIDGEFAGGYPRFVIPGDVKRATFEIMGTLGWLPFPTEQAAKDALHLTNTYVTETERNGLIVERAGIFWVESSKINIDSWQYTGLGVSSRQARATAQSRALNDLDARSLAESEIRADILRHTGVRGDDVYFFPTGMAAVHMINKLLVEISGGAPSIQFGFPYTDTWEIQRKYGAHAPMNQNVFDQRLGNVDELRELLEGQQALRGLFLEWPSNPLLAVPDLDQISQLIGGRAPIVLDDTVGTMFNLDNRALPDEVALVVRSLTKFYSSVGNAMGGTISLRQESPHYEALKAAIEKLYEDNLWFEDAQVLAKNGRSFDEIMPAINHNALAVASWMNERFAGQGGPIRKIYYPGLNDRDLYQRHMTKHGGFGGLMTVEFEDPEVAYRFYDALHFTKGPSLGTYYSLACLYTRLAHKDVMPFIEKFGVLPHLIRMSIGIEAEQELLARCESAMGFATGKSKIFS